MPIVPMLVFGAGAVSGFAVGNGANKIIQLALLGGATYYMVKK